MMKLFYKRKKSPARETRKEAEGKESNKIIMLDVHLMLLIDYIEAF